MQMTNKNGFSRCAEFYIGRLRRKGRHSTAYIYKNTILSFGKFCGTSSVSFRQATREHLRRYGQYLYGCGSKPNAISTYMRMLRCIYNRGAEVGSAPYVPRLLHDVYTEADVCQKKASSIGKLRRLLYEDPKSECLRRIQAIAVLMLQSCGISFAGLAHLEKSVLDQNALRYNCIKTRTPISMEIFGTTKEMINRLYSNQDSHPDSPGYLLNILSSGEKRTDERAYREYQSAFRRFNSRLKDLAKALRSRSPVTSYTLRHFWTMTAKYRGVSIGMINKSLGHKFIKIAQIYPKGSGPKECTEVNKGNLPYVRNYCVDRW